MSIDRLRLWETRAIVYRVSLDSVSSQLESVALEKLFDFSQTETRKKKSDLLEGDGAIVWSYSGMSRTMTVNNMAKQAVESRSLFDNKFSLSPSRKCILV